MTAIISIHGSRVTIDTVEGNDTITNFDRNDSIKMTAGKTFTYDTDGNDVLVTLKGTAYTGTVRLLDVADKKFIFKGSAFTMQDAADTVTNSRDNVKFIGTSDAEWLINTGQHVTVEPRGGDDTITGDNDSIKSTAGKFNSLATDGDNVIVNFGANDTLRMTSGTSMTGARDGDGDGDIERCRVEHVPSERRRLDAADADGHSDRRDERSD